MAEAEAIQREMRTARGPVGGPVGGPVDGPIRGTEDMTEEEYRLWLAEGVSRKNEHDPTADTLACVILKDSNSGAIRSSSFAEGKRNCRTVILLSAVSVFESPWW